MATDWDVDEAHGGFIAWPVHKHGEARLLEDLDALRTWIERNGEADLYRMTDKAENLRQQLLQEEYEAGVA